MTSIPVEPYKNIDINEGSTSILEVTYLDKDRANITPSTASYRIDDQTNVREVLDWTSIATPGLSDTITITPAQNQVKTRSQDRELRQVTVNATDSSGIVAQQIFFYTLIRIFDREDQEI